jgi:hypothetical protein
MNERAVSKVAIVEELMRRDTPPSLEAVFRIVKDWGCRVNNLFHRMDGQWQANLRSRNAYDFFQFAWGPTAVDAMLAALMRVAKSEFVARPAVGDDDLDATMVGATRVTSDQLEATPAAAPAVVDDDDEDLIG